MHSLVSQHGCQIERKMIDAMLKALDDRSREVRVYLVHALAATAQQDPSIKLRLRRLAEEDTDLWVQGAVQDALRGQQIVQQKSRL